MFEYLMPMLVMPNYDGSLLDQTCRAAVAVQIEHGNRLGIPWGVSESGYYTVDAHFNYQYRAFGVQALGLKRGLSDDVVIAPYASALALMVDAEAACKNLQRLSRQGSSGRFGLYEALDYTEARVPRGQTLAVVRSFMAHHQGMSLLALTSQLLDQTHATAIRGRPGTAISPAAVAGAGAKIRRAVPANRTDTCARWMLARARTPGFGCSLIQGANVRRYNCCRTVATTSC